MVVRGNLRIETYRDISTSVPVMVAERNPYRWKLRVKTDDSNGLYVGLDRALTTDTAYFASQNSEVRFEKYKGEVWVLAVSGTPEVWVMEESEER